MQVVLVTSFLSVVASSALLIFAFVGNNLSPDVLLRTHAEHSTVTPTEPVNLERILTTERAGDALVASSLSIDNEFIDDMNSCHFCTRIEYSPGPEGKAIIAFKGDKLNLTGYQRLVFFARAEEEQEVSFMAIGRPPLSGIWSGVNVLPDQHYAIITRNVTLDNDWKRFEINVNQTSLEEVNHPFGFILTDHGSGLAQIFYLKGITFDRKQAESPLPSAKLST